MKAKDSILIRWWILAALILLGFGSLYPAGVLEKVNNADITKVSFLIFGLFFYYSAKIGTYLWKINSKSKLSKHEVETYRHKTETGWFVADALFILGFFGTVVGITYGTEGFKEFTDSAKVVTTMGTGIGTALYTTIAGLVSGLLLKWQLFMICHYLDGLEKDCKSGSCSCKEKNEVI